MAERFDAYYGSIGCKSTGRHIHADGEFVLASDYAALEAELSRVKAESLRVVKVGEAVDLSCLPASLRFSVSGQTGVYRRIGSGASAIPEPHSFLIIEDCNSGEEVNVPYGTPVQPVRLERWEDEG